MSDYVFGVIESANESCASFALDDLMFAFSTYRFTCDAATLARDAARFTDTVNQFGCGFIAVEGMEYWYSTPSAAKAAAREHLAAHNDVDDVLLYSITQTLDGSYHIEWQPMAIER